MGVDDAVVESRDGSSGPLSRLRHGRHQRFGAFVHHHRSRMEPHDQPARFVNAAAVAVFVSHGNRHTPHERRETRERETHPLLDTAPFRGNQSQIFAVDRDAHRTVSFSKTRIWKLDNPTERSA
jgi:hypothetical protein